jgi:hypothetical protein
LLSVPAPVARAQQAPSLSDSSAGAQLMRRVIEHKRLWRSGLDTYRSEMASRFTLLKGEDISFIEETASTVYWRRRRGPWQVVTERSRTANEQGYRVASPSPALNFYDDEVRIGGFRLIGPTHPDALEHYRFRIAGRSRADDGTPLRKVAVTPTARLQPAFAGTLWVQTDPPALRRVELRPARGVIFQPPVQKFEGTYRQRFKRVAGRFWLPANLDIQGRLEVGVPTIQFPTMRFRQRARFSNYQPNAPVPDSLFQSAMRRRVLATARPPDALPDVLPRTGPQRSAFARLSDGAPRLDEVFEPRGFGTWLGPLSWWLFDLDVNFDPQRRARRERQERWQLLRPQLWYDRVDGFHLGASPRLNFNRRFQLTATGAYETNLERFSYGGTAEGWIGPHRQIELGASYRDGTDRRFGRHLRGTRLANGIDMLLGDQDYFDYYENRRARGWLRYHVRPANLRLGVRFSDERHRSVATDTSDIQHFDVRAGVTNNILTEIIFGGDDRQRLNPSIEEGHLRSLRFQVAWRDGRGPLGARGQRGARLTVETSRDALGSDFAFTRYELDANWRFDTYLARRRYPLTLDVYATAGGSTGDLRPQRVGTLPSDLSQYPDLGMFRTLDGLPYEGEHWAGLFWMHDFRTVPFELMGLDWLVERGLSLVLYGGHGRTWMSANRRTEFENITGIPPKVAGDFHHEVGLSLNGVLGLVHIDLTARLDESSLEPGLGLARVF